MADEPRSGGRGDEPGADREAIGRSARRFFEELWTQSDPWALDESALDRRRYDRQLQLLADRSYARALEIGCAGGSFTRSLAPLCEELVALDISEAAIARARESGVPQGVEFRVANAMDLDLEREGTWDLVVLTETAYYLGWKYPMFEVAWLAHTLHEATRPDGRLLLVNTIFDEDGLMAPWLIRSYRDLVANVGYAVEHEETMCGIKETVELEILISLFVKPG